MTAPTVLLRSVCRLAGLSFCLAAGLATAQPMGAGLAQYELRVPQRLSGWLHEHAAEMAATEPLALGWSTPQERERQVQLRRQDVTWLRRALLRPADSSVWRWLEQSPVTGRMVLPAQIAPWLEGVPSRDPVLRPGDTLWTVPVGQPVRVLDGRGQVCTVAHSSGAYPADYLKACGQHDHGKVWVVQPDGRVRLLPLQVWQPEPQPQLAPGAVLWLGWSSQQLRPDVDAQDLDDINARTAAWLARAQALDWRQWMSDVAPELAGPEGAGDVDWLGIKGARFAPVASTSNWGLVGLMQTPTARMRPAGSFSASWLRTQPHTWMNVVLQPLEWLEGGFRYVAISNRMYGPADFSGSQSLKDKSFEVKARMWRESDWTPELALGIRDLGGTGLFGGEYLVASKRWGRLDTSLGLGWGHVGSRGTWQNPLSVLGSRFDVRQNQVGVGGTLSTNAYFRGRVAPFGGIEYQSPWGPAFKVEYNGNNYRHEPKDNNLPVRSPLNWGVVYRWAPGVDLHASWERGNTLGVGLSLWTDLSVLSMPKLTDKPLPPVAAAYPQTAPDWQITLKDIEAYTQWQVRKIEKDGPTLGVVVARSQDAYLLPRFDRIMRVVHRDAPADVQQVEVRHWAAGDVLAIDRLDRQQWLQNQSEPPRTASPQPLYTREWPDMHSQSDDAKVLAQSDKAFDLYSGLSFKQSLGGPDAFMLYKLSLTLTAEARLPLGLQLHGVAEARTLSNYDRFQFRGHSAMTRVRTYLREYETQSRYTLPRLYLIRTMRWTDSVSASVYGGILESMYAGAGGEVLYRPRGSALAVGVDMNRVQQRDFAQDFRLRDYKANTGHLTTYWETPWHGLVGALSVGQYLAGDRGVTLSVARTFRNGSAMGVFATKTNVSAQQFGEGSFNKGVFWSIPFDAFMTSSSRLRANFSWIPLTRDGGAMLARPYVLHGETGQLSPNATFFEPAQPRRRIPDDLN